MTRNAAISRPKRAQRVDYHKLNDGTDEEASEEDRLPKKKRTLPSSDHSETSGTEYGDIETSGIDSGATRPAGIESGDPESVGADPGSPDSVGPDSGSPDSVGPEGSTIVIPQPSRNSPNVRHRWLWDHFSVVPLPGKLWRPKRSSKVLEDREIKCRQCNWKTTDSVRATSTTNMKVHLAKHIGDSAQDKASGRNEQPTVATLFRQKTDIDVKSAFESNILRWIVTEDIPFTAVESPHFQRIFRNIPDASLPLVSSTTIARRVSSDFHHYRLALIDDLAQTCSTIALSLDVWSSKNQKSVIGVIGHWLSEDFIYRENVLEFREIYGAHSGETLAELVHEMLVELRLEEKLITVTADNASNNETLVSELYATLLGKHASGDDIEASDKKCIRFRGRQSYVRCIAHILNLIVKDILAEFEPNYPLTPEESWGFSHENEIVDRQSALTRLRMITLWISRTSQRRQEWKIICQTHGLNDRFIRMDVETRWNSTYRMLTDALNAKPQIKKWLDHHPEFPRFSSHEWQQLHRLASILGSLMSSLF